MSFSLLSLVSHLFRTTQVIIQKLSTLVFAWNCQLIHAVLTFAICAAFLPFFKTFTILFVTLYSSASTTFLSFFWFLYFFRLFISNLIRLTRLYRCTLLNFHLMLILFITRKYHLIKPKVFIEKQLEQIRFAIFIAEECCDFLLSFYCVRMHFLVYWRLFNRLNTAYSQTNYTK